VTTTSSWRASSSRTTGDEQRRQLWAALHHLALARLLLAAGRARSLLPAAVLTSRAHAAKGMVLDSTDHMLAAAVGRCAHAALAYLQHSTQLAEPRPPIDPLCRREMYQCLQLLAERTQRPFVELVCGSAEDAAGGDGWGGGEEGDGSAGCSEGVALRLSPIPVFWLARSALDPGRVLGLCSAVVWS
jgi:hypothetical protein